MKERLLVLPVLLMIAISCSRLATLIPTPLLPTTISTPTYIPLTNIPTKITITKPPIASPIPSPTTQPVWEWPRSTPEEQGLSSATLAAMVEAVRQEKLALHSILVVRHGVLVLEAYNHPFNGETRQSVYSVTKSITSALVGIAIADGNLNSVDSSVVSYFPSVSLDDPRKEAIQVENLLAMNSGIEWMEPLHSGLNDLWGIIEADDPAQYFFNPALVEEPGAVFNYNSGGSHLLSMLVQETVGQPASDLATERLFTPLGIRDYFWKSDFTGHSIGGTGLELRPVDMIKIGQLYLDYGEWQGRQIIPSDWVSASSRVHSNPSSEVGYGYQWWIRPQGDYYALGWGGQKIRVFPEQDMVVVFTAGESGEGMLHNDLVDSFILPAVRSENPLPANPQGQAQLTAAIDKLASPQVWPSQPSSPLTSEVEGKQWLVTGMGEWSMFSLHFFSSSEAQLDLTLDGDKMPLRVGLDGIFRVTDTNDIGPVALIGYWESPDTFILVQQNLRDADRRMTRLHFEGDKVKLNSVWFVEPYEEESEAELFGE